MPGIARVLSRAWRPAGGSIRSVAAQGRGPWAVLPLVRAPAGLVRAPAALVRAPAALMRASAALMRAPVALVCAPAADPPSS